MALRFFSILKGVSWRGPVPASLTTGLPAGPTGPQQSLSSTAARLVCRTSFKGTFYEVHGATPPGQAPTILLVPDLNTLAKAGLQALCRQHGRSPRGTKSALVERLEQEALTLLAWVPAAAKATTTMAPLALSSVKPLTAAAMEECLLKVDLQALCRLNYLSPNGEKAALVTRLRESVPATTAWSQEEAKAAAARATSWQRQRSLPATLKTLDSKLVSDLRVLCQQHGVPATGNRPVLVQRLQNAVPSLRD